MMMHVDKEKHEDYTDTNPFEVIRELERAGMRKAKVVCTKRMLAEGISHDIIKRVTGLSDAELGSVVEYCSKIADVKQAKHKNYSHECRILWHEES